MSSTGEDKIGQVVAGDKLRVSILVPVYNVAAYLEECVLSIVSQLETSEIREGEVELLLLDDCSTDGSRTLAEKLCARWPETIRLVYHEENGGLSKARNSLLDAAKGEYIWFLDSDDYLLPGCIKKLCNIINAHQPDLILCDYRKRRYIKKKSFPGSGRGLENDTAKLVSGVFEYRKMYSWLKISRRTLWGDDIRFPVGRTFEDIATTPWLLLCANSYYYVPEMWVHYRIRPNSIMTSVTRTKGHFDVRKNDDMATAMLGFKDKLDWQIGKDNERVAFHVSHFIAQEFVKLAKRYDLAKKKGDNAQLSTHPLRGYYDNMQRSSILSFQDLLLAYLKRLDLPRYLLLRGALKTVEQHERESHDNVR